MHVPMIFLQDREQPEPQQRVELYQLLARPPSMTEVFCGHVHRKVKGKIAGLAASAITCMASDLCKGELTDESATNLSTRKFRLWRLRKTVSVKARTGSGAICLSITAFSHGALDQLSNIVDRVRTRGLHSEQRYVR